MSPPRSPPLRYRLDRRGWRRRARPWACPVAATPERLARHGCHRCILLAAVLGNGVDGGGGVVGSAGAVGPQLIRPGRQNRQSGVGVLGEDDAQLRRQPL